MVITLALTCALAWGLSDFLGGLWSRRNGPWVTAVAVQVGALGATAVAWVFQGGGLSTHDLRWAVVAGMGVGAGTALLYRGLSRGTMGVVAPISALSAALVPLTVGLALGERPGTWATLGIAAALPAIWLVSADPEERAVRITSAAAIDGLWSGLGFGLAFVGLDQMTPEAGLTPLVVMQVLSILPVVLFARATGEAVLPRTKAAWTAAWIGPLGAAANLTFRWAVQVGPLTVTSVLASLYPAATVVLATIFLRERIRRTQATGLALAGLAVVLISLH